ncbi:uracil-xanthine permease family protein [Lachnoclostridium phytofermentans]|uniref:Uracil-xanthine permease n=1 Tax=Lachnoclostridium phytofermentans (strain ATCC 700394 / DSM 18823 / ISDg) TaxID=357809 RepID=A9KHE9_LACP7|nr:uracil-xanthine permease family protein [Lachnoclostridium phytofermentans]ABX40816.1 uracil-xanthine permease [Lachnoclostridium phytofermentans ISDg]
MTKEQNTIGTVGIYDARALGLPKMILLGLQHAFAMFGATVLVPLLTGLNVSTTLLMAGLGTLLFHILTKGKVPAFLGSSFAFIGGYLAVAPFIETEVNGQIIRTPNTELLPYACGGVVIAGLVYVVLAALIKVFGVNKIMRFFPPVVTGPIIISIGLILAPTAIANCQQNWLLAFVALAVIIICNIYGKGMVKIVPIMLGIIVSYIVALITGAVDFTAVTSANWIGNPVPLSGFAKFSVSSIISIVPISLATMMEHIGDISAISATTGKNYMTNPGLHRTLLGDGLATSMSAIFGGPANTTYGENTGVLALTKVYDPKVMQIAACFAVFLSFFPKFSAIINTLPVAIIGGVSLILYGMISSVGIRNVVENRVDFTQSRNLIIAAIILGCALGFTGINGLTFMVGSYEITLSGLAVAAIAGIVLNAILPGNDYVFSTEEKHDELTFKL